MKQIICFVGLCVFLFFPKIVSAGQSIEVRSAMYADKEFQSEQYVFLPLEKMYLVLDLTNVPPGDYNLAVEWVTPLGNLERLTHHQVTPQNTLPSYRVHFWFKLLKKGPLSRSLTGLDYKEEFYGEWKVRVFLNGKKVVEKNFRVN